MKIFNRVSIAILSVAFILGAIKPTTAMAAIAPNLGAAESYSVFGKAGITNTGAPTHVWGNVGADLLANIDLIASQVDGTIIAPAAGVQTAITAAYGQLNSQGADGGQTLSGTVTINPGVWTVGAATVNGTVTLSGAGVYILRSSSSVTVEAGAQVLLTNGAQACNVFWQVPDAMTIGVGAHVEGTIISDTSLISLATNASLVGRALSSVAQVTLDSNLITEPTCVSPPPASGGPLLVQVPPLINITKVPNILSVPSGGGSVSYDYTVLNIGTVSMNNVTVTDNKCAPVSFLSGDTNGNSVMEVNETWRYRCTTLVSQTTTNTATATGQANGFTAIDNANATVVVNLPVIPPLIHLVKIPNTFLLPVGGGAVTYSYTVTNPGTQPLNNVSVIDDKCTGLPGRVVGHPGDLNGNNLLENNETWTFTCQSNLTQTTTNIGTAQGYANGLTAIDYSLATVVVIPPTLPKTGFPPQENNILWNILTPAGIFVALVSFYLARKKQII